MNKRTYNLKEMVEGNQYSALLKFSLDLCDRFTLVIRPTLGLNAKAIQAIETLLPFLLSSKDKSSWPGTELLVGKATVNEYTFNRDSLEMILRLSNSLYEWKQPYLPEDLALIRNDHSLFLGSIAHESDAFMILTRKELDLLRKIIPTLTADEDV